MTAKELAEKLLQYPDYQVMIACESEYKDTDFEVWDTEKTIYFRY
jgi:hypothetical protein